MSGKGNLKPGFEFCVRLDAVGADAEDHRALFLELRVGIPKAASLYRAAGRVVPGIEVEHDGLALQILELDFLARVGPHP